MPAHKYTIDAPLVFRHMLRYGLSYSDFAAQCKMPERYIRRLLSGGNTICRGRISFIAYLIGTDWKTLAKLYVEKCQ
ncbi:MAG: hypothetical protein FWE38_01770 [Firmicutes bacterium]|nr:hypothetical protein [Bacillota bacterium]